jgi:hypothetical protein
MANDISARPWRLDTATPGVPVWTSWIKVAHFEFSNYGAQGNKCILKDQNGRIVWSVTGAADLEEVRSGKVSMINGLIPDTIQGGGIVIAYIE